MSQKKPQDHKPTTPRFSDVDGHDLLTPISKVKGSDQARLTARLRALGVLDLDDEETSDDWDVDLDQVADLIDWVAERFAPDLRAFEEFTMGPGGMERALNLVIAFAGELGKDAS